MGYGGGGWDDSSIVRQAEERTRSTFQSVETVVGAFASVSCFLPHSPSTTALFMYTHTCTIHVLTTGDYDAGIYIFCRAELFQVHVLCTCTCTFTVVCFVNICTNMYIYVYTCVCRNLHRIVCVQGIARSCSTLHATKVHVGNWSRPQASISLFQRGAPGDESSNLPCSVEIMPMYTGTTWWGC